MYFGKEYEKLRELNQKYSMVLSSELPEDPGVMDYEKFLNKINKLKEVISQSLLIQEGEEVKMVVEAYKDYMDLLFNLQLFDIKRRY